MLSRLPKLSISSLAALGPRPGVKLKRSHGPQSFTLGVNGFELSVLFICVTLRCWARCESRRTISRHLLVRTHRC